MIERLRRDLRVSVAEVGDNDLWNVAVIGVACVGISRVDVEQTLGFAETLISEFSEVRVEGVLREIS